jgi:hypothetical protein
MQTFLILLEIISVNSAKQLQSDSGRVRKHIQNTTYKSNLTNTFINETNFYSTTSL